ncbi:hypothetical protein OHR68_13415 [Spirillospora sp. NBC_00431]
MEYVGLAEALALVREELGAAQDAAQGQQMQFQVLEVEMEFGVELRKEGGTDGKLALGVLTAGGSGKASRADTHRLLVRLEVRDAATGGGPVDVRRSGSRSWDE